MNLLCRKNQPCEPSIYLSHPLHQKSTQEHTKTYHFLLHLARGPQNHHFKPYDQEGKCERPTEGSNQTLCLLLGVHVS